uniref:Kalata-B7 n=2 Tax=Oldenlandia affinis TaxID=60225 RepID=KAB7_OLDAF|nr:RecName: Full=Kalata-B7; Flags: Precursor [Oldenlandia affinis]AAL05479.1 kalata B7 precursor [Oldenlandia affinis]
MAKFTNCLALCLLLAAVVGAFGVELSEADKSAVVNEIAEKMALQEMLDGVDKLFLRKMKSSETTLTMFLKEMQLKGLPVCGETCTLGTCYTQGCTCSWPICKRNGLPDVAA